MHWRTIVCLKQHKRPSVSPIIVNDDDILQVNYSLPICAQIHGDLTSTSFRMNLLMKTLDPSWWDDNDLILAV